MTVLGFCFEVPPFSGIFGLQFQSNGEEEVHRQEKNPQHSSYSLATHPIRITKIHQVMIESSLGLTTIHIQSTVSSTKATTFPGLAITPTTLILSSPTHPTTTTTAKKMIGFLGSRVHRSCQLVRRRRRCRCRIM